MYNEQELTLILPKLFDYVHNMGLSNWHDKLFKFHHGLVYSYKRHYQSFKYDYRNI